MTTKKDNKDKGPENIDPKTNEGGINGVTTPESMVAAENGEDEGNGAVESNPDITNQA
jgi:hypothetical protein